MKSTGTSIVFDCKKFEDLTLLELYRILALRSEIFVVEQDCVYQDIDNKDQKALHLIGTVNSKIVAYSRIFDAGDYAQYASIGRVVVDCRYRNFGYGHNLLEYSIQVVKDMFKTHRIELSGQTYLLNFYRFHQFQPIGSEYLEDGIPHIRMLYSTTT